MIHVRNSILGGVFILEHDGIPTAVKTDFNEPIANGSLCIDNTNDNLYILKNQIWTIIGGSSTSGDFNNVNVVATNYNNLVTASTSGTLIEGALYKFEYQNIHLIPGTNTLNVDSPDYVEKTETFLATATSPNTIDKKVFSVNHPTDEIEFDLFDNVAEDGTSGRTGKVYRRIDTILRRDTPYDHRSTYFRRTKINSLAFSNYSTSGSIAYSTVYGGGSSHVYKQDDETIYLAIRDILDKENQEFSPYLWKKVFPNYKKFACYTDFDNIYPYDNALNEDLLTFETDAITDIQIERSELFGLNNYYNDVVFYGTCSNIKLNGFVRSSTFDNTSNVEINKDAYGVILSDCLNFTGENILNTIAINSNNVNMLTKYDITLPIDNKTYITNSNNVNLGKNAVGNSLVYASNIELNEESKGNTITITNNASIKKVCLNNYIESIDTVHLDDRCINIKIFSDLFYLRQPYGDSYGAFYGCEDLVAFCGQDIRFESGCEDITIYDYAKKLRVGKDCRIVNLMKIDNLSIGDNLTKSYIVRAESSVIGEGCSRIFASLINSTIENFCNEIEETLLYNSTVKKSTSILSRSGVYNSIIDCVGINNGIFNCLIDSSTIEYTYGSDNGSSSGAIDGYKDYQGRMSYVYGTAGETIPVTTDYVSVPIFPRGYTIADSMITDSRIINSKIFDISPTDRTDIKDYLSTSTILDTQIRAGIGVSGSGMIIKSSNIEDAEVYGQGLCLFNRVKIPKSLRTSRIFMDTSVLHDVSYSNSVYHDYSSCVWSNVIYDNNISEYGEGLFPSTLVKTSFSSVRIDTANIKAMRASNDSMVFSNSDIERSTIYIGIFRNTADNVFTLDIANSIINCEIFEIPTGSKRIIVENSNITSARTVRADGDIYNSNFSSYSNQITVNSTINGVNEYSNQSNVTLNDSNTGVKVDNDDFGSGTNFRQPYIDKEGFVRSYSNEYVDLGHSSSGATVDFDLLDTPIKNGKITTNNDANFRINLTNPYKSGEYNIVVTSGTPNLAVEIYDNDNTTLIDTLTIVTNGASGIFNIRYIDSSFGYLVKLTEY
jgi:hypothetical protein